jgi:hypothetical protein
LPPPCRERHESPNKVEIAPRKRDELTPRAIGFAGRAAGPPDRRGLACPGQGVRPLAGSVSDGEYLGLDGSNRALFVAPPDFVADFLGDHCVAYLEVMQQPHLHLGADGKRATCQSRRRKCETLPTCQTRGKHAVGRCEALDGLKHDPLRGAK